MQERSVRFSEKFCNIALLKHLEKKTTTTCYKKGQLGGHTVIPLVCMTKYILFQSAFEALCQSTHLYGRRLVLEWAEQGEEGEDVAALRKRTAQAYHAAAPGGKKSRKGAVDAETFVET